MTVYVFYRVDGVPYHWESPALPPPTLRCAAMIHYLTTYFAAQVQRGGGVFEPLFSVLPRPLEASR